MPETKEWTLMFYFASDNPLAPGITSQLKAIKSAGFHKQANVIVQFDPYTEGTPTHIFDVNIIKKLESADEFNIGFNEDDPFVRNMVEDKLWRNERDRGGELIRDRIRKSVPDYAPGIPPNGIIENNGTRVEPSPLMSLQNFLRFCSGRYPAKHYILFILGHGVVVGNDVFLFDEHADEHSLSLTGLRRVLEEFTLDIRSHFGTFELISFHSCSVSSLEVAFELKDTARYMLASQGSTFVGSWPYHQILIRLFKDLKFNRNELTDDDIKKTLGKIFAYCLHNSTDFLLAGYPFDLCLCDLTQISAVKPELDKFARALIKGLEHEAYRDAIVLAHWESQSFYQEMYTDIVDFCRCLYLRLKKLDAVTGQGVASATALEATNGQYTSGSELPVPVHRQTPAIATGLAAATAVEAPANLAPEICVDSSRPDLISTGIQTACEHFVNAIKKSIVDNGFAGPEYQYARGLSVYFPWSRPSADSGILFNYANYKLSGEEREPGIRKDEPNEPTWLDFLDHYFDATMRPQTRNEEKAITAFGEKAPEALTVKQALLEDEIALLYTQAALQTGQSSPGSLLKIDKSDPMGGSCSCGSIKNYPPDIRQRGHRRSPRKGLPIAPVFLGDN